MKIVTTIQEAKEQVKEWREQGLSVGLVPSMGYLHEGHASLMKEAKKQMDKVAVSVFVNPTQFGPDEDYDSYPRDLDHDIAVCEEALKEYEESGRKSKPIEELWQELGI